MGDGASELVRRALPGDRQHLHAELLANYKARYRTHLIVDTRPFAGVEDTLARLARRPCSRLCSGSPRSYPDRSSPAAARVPPALATTANLDVPPPAPLPFPWFVCPMRRADAVQAELITQHAAEAGVQAFTYTGRTRQVWVMVRNGVIQNAGVNPLGAFR